MGQGRSIPAVVARFVVLVVLVSTASFSCGSVAPVPTSTAAATRDTATPTAPPAAATPDVPVPQAGSDPTPTAAPRPTSTVAPADPRIFNDTSLPVDIAPLAAGLGLLMDTVASVEQADIVVSYAPPPPQFKAERLGREYWVPVAPIASMLKDVSRQALTARLWHDDDGAQNPPSTTSSGPITLASEDAAPLGVKSPVAAASVRILPSREQVVATVARGEAQMGLLPLFALSVYVRPLSIDGQSPIFDAPRPEAALTTDIWLGWRESALPDSARVGALGRLLKDQLAPYLLTPDQLITMNVAGDIILGRTVDRILRTAGDWRKPFLAVADRLLQADIQVADMENPLTDRYQPISDPYTFTFFTSTRGVEGLTFAGFDAVSLANNHSFNIGGEAVMETIDLLRRNGIATFGAGKDLGTAHVPAVIERKGIRFAFLGYDDVTGHIYNATATRPGVAAPTVAQIKADIADARRVADVVIPWFHWGIEYRADPTARQRLFAHAAVEAGVPLVLGSHPHWVQAAEIENGAFIAYGLGNFVFDQSWSTETQQGAMLQAAFIGTQLVAVNFVPYHIYEQHQPRWVGSPEADVILNRIYTASKDWLLPQ